ncbi:MAG: succinylglutamate desuccinylase/aspartoacylase family protein [Opitutaceae bacterium]|nr:succinylglutamate desuccinylase/aspartoacylase family protein [Opitutaceae bacterium]
MVALAHPRMIDPAPRARMRALLAPLFELTLQDSRLEGMIAGVIDAGCGERLPIPRFVYRGPTTDLESVRLALFALVHGDEPAGATAIFHLLVTAVQDPSLLRGVDLFCYPVCNPTGFADGTRCNRAGVDLNREFWRGSSHGEVQILEAELRAHRFDGLVALHADCDSPGMYAFARGPVTSDELVAPALAASESVLPRNTDVVIDGFSAHHGVIRDCYEGVLAPPPEQSPAPFEIILETPGRASEAAQVQAALSGLRGLIATLPRLSRGGFGI